MRVLTFHGSLKFILILMVSAILAGIVTQPAAAVTSNDHSWFKLTAEPVTEKVCINRPVDLYYTIVFDGTKYCLFESCGKKGAVFDTGPVLDVLDALSGMLEPRHYQLDSTLDTTLIARWQGKLIYTPKRAGKAIVALKTTFAGSNATDDFEFVIKDPCPTDVVINADQSMLRIKRQKINEIQKTWTFSTILEGYARILSDPLEDETGSGGNKRLAVNLVSTFHNQESTGTLNLIHDAFFMGLPDSDVTCSMDGSYICTSEFTVHPIPGEETIDYEIDVGTTKCNSWKVTCKSPSGGGQTTLPPLTMPGYDFTATLPREGGTTNVVKEFQQGSSIEFQVSAFPVDEE
jgi:hypothetical protein